MTIRCGNPIRSFALVLDAASTGAGTRLWRHWALRASRTGGVVTSNQTGAAVDVLSPRIVSWQASPAAGEDLVALVAAAGRSVEGIAAALADVATGCPVLIWPDGRLQDLIALAYACEVVGGRGGIETVLMDLGPAEVHQLDSPFGRATLARCEDVLAACGIRLYLVARERSSQDIFAACGVRRIRSPQRLIQDRRAPDTGPSAEVTRLELRIGAAQSPQQAAKAPHQLFAEAFDRRRRGPVTVLLVGSEGLIARLGPWIEDCIECDIGVDLQPEGAVKVDPGAASLSWLEASPLLRAARLEPSDGVAMAFRRTGSSSGDPATVLSALLDRIAPFGRLGFKDVSRPHTLLRLDQRAHS